MAIGVKGKNVQAPHLSREGATLIVTPNGTPRFYGVRVMPFGYSQLYAIHFGQPMVLRRATPKRGPNPTNCTLVTAPARQRHGIRFGN